MHASTVAERRARLMASLRVEVGSAGKPSSAHHAEIHHRASANADIRRELYEKQFHGSNAFDCIRQAPVPVSTPRVNSPRRSFSPAAKQDPITHGPIDRSKTAERHAAPTPIIPDHPMDLHGRTLMSYQQHHKDIIFKESAGASTAAAAGDRHDKLWVAKPLANGTRFVPSKRVYHDVKPSSRSNSPSGILPPTPASEPRTAAAKKTFTPDSSIQGCGIDVTKDYDYRVPHRVEKHYTTRAPYLETTADAAAAASGTSSKPETARSVGLLGYGPTGRRYLSQQDAPNVTEFKPEGWTDVARPKSGPAEVKGKSQREPFQSVLYRQEAHTEPPVEQKFKPCLVVMQGPPPFVPPALPSRTSSPAKRAVPQPSSDIFLTGAPSSAVPSPIRRGRSPGTFSPLRSERPFN